MSQNKTLTISLPLYTHIPKTNNKTKANKMFKVNNQAIYNGSLNKFARAIVVQFAHDLVMNCIPDEYFGLKLSKVESIHYEIRTVINHGTIRMLKGEKKWTKAKPGYKPNFDIENIASFWTKVGNDALVQAGVLEDDNVSVIKKISYEFTEVKHIDDLELEVIVKY